MQSSDAIGARHLQSKTHTKRRKENESEKKETNEKKTERKCQIGVENPIMLSFEDNSCVQSNNNLGVSVHTQGVK